MSFFVVGVGASGGQAAELVAAGIAAVSRLRHVELRAESRRYANPAWGGATRAPFVNAAVVVASVLPAPALLSALFSVESAFGRVRSDRKNQARTLDLDVLWADGIASTTTCAPVVPHPRLLERSFALIPAVEALRAAGIAVPWALAAAARRHALAPLQALPAR
ncbi:MAG: 2-amino-4-hydroxy-6-hydroxymethyldihydropteridine diphosphokinase [Deltaproteobacteria bacterium]|nr:2-amino-4-hydroxy-6-hydroxymethyldihydropteridine diphosphokinase [Deltaproteobacteria bacterium]